MAIELRSVTKVSKEGLEREGVNRWCPSCSCGILCGVRYILELVQ